MRDLLLFFLVFMANFKIFRDHYVRTSSKLTLPSERSLSLSTSLLYFVVIQTKTCQAQAHVERINLAITSPKKKKQLQQEAEKEEGKIYKKQSNAG